MLIAIWVPTVYDFDFVSPSGGEQTFTAPADGYYKLEVWGAQGGSYSSSLIGGKGGYSIGDIILAKDVVIYVNVGGTGGSVTSQNASASGGYNGGGNSSNGYPASASGGGGGATHIGKISGTLDAYTNSYQSNLYVVAGGGGGYAYYYDVNSGSARNMNGGNGGGLNGENGNPYSFNTGATQTGPGWDCTATKSGHCSPPSFGKGGGRLNTSPISWYGGGGGGGLYGGGIGDGQYPQGGGGSGYISGVLNGSTISGVREGNGYARITYLGTTI